MRCDVHKYIRSLADNGFLGKGGWFGSGMVVDGIQMGVSLDSDRNIVGTIRLRGLTRKLLASFEDQWWRGKYGQPHINTLNKPIWTGIH